MGSEPLEKLRLYHLVLYAAADSGRVVKDQHDRHSADVSKYILQALADAFCCFSAEDLQIAIIAVREGYRQVFPPYTYVVLIEVRFSKVCLRIARLPDQFLRSLALFIGSGLTNLLHVPLDH